MKLNADIIYEHLSKCLTLQRFGPVKKNLSLGRPIFLDTGDRIRDGKVYLTATVSPCEIPRSFHCLFIYMDQKLPIHWQNSGQEVFLIAENVDPMWLMNRLQDIFDLFEVWDEALRRISTKEADIKKMIQYSAEIFENQLIVNDKNLKVLANYSRNMDTGRWQMEGGYALKAPDARILEEIYNREKSKYKEPMLFQGKVANKRRWIYRSNIFTSGLYDGCVTLVDANRPFQDGDFALLQHLAKHIKTAMHRLASIAPANSSSTKSLIKDLLNAIPVDEYRIRRAIAAEIGPFASPPGSWICCKIRLREGAARLPLDFIAASLEEGLDGVFALVHCGDVVVFAAANEEKYTFERHFAAIEQTLEGLEFQVGVSDVFCDIAAARIHYRQASCALELWSAEKSEGHFGHFNGAVLPYMLRHCRGEFTYDAILSPGLHRLKEQSEEGAVDYWRTLLVYLDNELNATKTARDLFIHRSTLLQRLEHIYGILGHRFSTPEERLYLRICLYMPIHTTDL